MTRNQRDFLMIPGLELENWAMIPKEAKSIALSMALTDGCAGEAINFSLEGNSNDCSHISKQVDPGYTWCLGLKT